MSEIGLLDYLAVCWRGRWQIVAATILPAVVAALVLGARPVRYEAEAALALSPPGFGQRVALIVAWGVAPDGVLRPPGEEIKAEHKDELLRVRAVASSAANATAAVSRLVFWITEEERHLPDPVPALPPRHAPKSPTTPEAITAWRGQLGEIERRLPGLSPGASPYWTARALRLHEEITVALRPEPPQPPAPKGEEATVLQRRPARAVPKPWLWTSLSAGVGGFVVLGIFALLVEEWWRAEVARRRSEPTKGD